jgi:hypothetical protein
MLELGERNRITIIRLVIAGDRRVFAAVVRQIFVAMFLRPYELACQQEKNSKFNSLTARYEMKCIRTAYSKAASSFVFPVRIFR